MKHRILAYVVVGALAVSLAGLSSCVNAGGDGWHVNGLGLDVEDLDVSAAGIKAKSLNTSKAFVATTELVRKMWNTYLVQQGLQWIGGKYYDHQNAVVAADQTVKLEQLRNAKSVADAKAALATLKETNKAAGAVAPAATAAPVP